jgi:hypothetical protein
MAQIEKKAPEEIIRQLLCHNPEFREKVISRIEQKKPKLAAIIRQDSSLLITLWQLAPDELKK